MTARRREPIVVDASLALKWVLDEPFSPEARALLSDSIAKSRVVLAPVLLASELANALFQRVRRGDLSLEFSRQALRAVLSEVNLIAGGQEWSERALVMAYRLGQRAVYDAEYAVLAEHEGCELWTADLRFYNAARSAFPWVRYVGQQRT